MRYEALIPHLTVRDAAGAIEFYKKVFGAEEQTRLPAPDGKRLMHAHLKLQGLDLMLADDFCEYTGRSLTPEALGGSPVTLHLHTDDADAVWEKALAGGATATMPLQDMFWGDRYGQFTDPFGQRWSVGQTLKKLNQEELQQEAAKAMR